MNIEIRRANLNSDRKDLIQILSRYLTPLSNDVRFDWLYRANPWGEALAWIAADREGRSIGMAAAFPRRIFIGDREESGWILGDFCVSDSYRSLGPALQLQRACLSDVDSGGMQLWYDFPSSKMMAIYLRMRINQFGRIFRLVKPLRVDRQVGKVIKSPIVARGLSAAGNALLKFYTRKSSGKGGITISLHQGDCGEEFTTLADVVEGRYGGCVRRSAEYLNWRYLAHPFCRYELLTARRNGSLVAYAIYTCSGDDATLVDLFGTNDSEILCELLESLTEMLRGRGVVMIHAPVFESHPWLPLLQSLGFRRREGSPVVFYVSPEHPSMRSVVECKNWLLMYGDRDS